jgi:hypothetical protein
MNDAEKAKVIARLEELTEPQVRLLLSKDGLPPTWNLTIIEWLGEKDAERRQKNDAWQDEQRQIATSAKKAAWIAAIAAIVACVITLLAWIWPR